MEIRTHTTPAPTPSVAIARPGEERDRTQAHRRVSPTVEVKTDNKIREHNKNEDKPVDTREEREPLVGAGEEHEPLEGSQVRLELHIDETTDQVFGRIVDKATGREIRQIPTEDIRHLQAISRELFVDLVDETV